VTPTGIVDKRLSLLRQLDTAIEKATYYSDNRWPRAAVKLTNRQQDTRAHYLEELGRLREARRVLAGADK
jgi:hypothetical protein